MKKRILAMVLVCLMTVSMMALAVNAQGVGLPVPTRGNLAAGVPGGASAYGLKPLPDSEPMYIDESEPNDLYQNADWISPYSVMFAQIQNSEDVDIFTVNVEAPGLLDTVITADSPNLQYAILDVDGQFVGLTSNSERVSDGSYLYNLSFYLGGSGTYYIMVIGAEPSTRPLQYSLYTTAQPYVNRFVDVQPGRYCYIPVQWADSAHVAGGMDPNHFYPDLECSRAQMVTFLWRYAGCPTVNYVSNPFADVQPGDYYYDAVMWALWSGITSGVEQNRFGSHEPCSRAQMVTFLWNLYGNTMPGTSAGFVDVYPGTYYYDAVQWAVEWGITSGVDEAHFVPNGLCTRGQAVTFLYNAP